MVSSLRGFCHFLCEMLGGDEYDVINIQVLFCCILRCPILHKIQTSENCGKLGKRREIINFKLKSINHVSVKGQGLLNSNFYLGPTTNMIDSNILNLQFT